MPPRRMPPLGKLYAMTSPRTRALAVGVAAIALVAKLGLVGAAAWITQGRVDLATVFGLGAGVVFALQRALASSLRVAVECDVYRAVSRAAVESDVLSVPTDPHHVVLESGHAVRTLLADTVPDLATSSLALAAIAPLLVGLLPARVLGLSAAALFVVMVAVLGVRRLNAEWQMRAYGAREAVVERTATAVEARLELVAGGREDALLASLEAAIARYTGLARRAAFASALLGRAPLALGVAIIVLVSLLDMSSRELVTAAVIGNAVVLAACVPVLLGVVFGLNELARAAPLVGPLAAMIAAPRRAELARAGDEPPTLPARVSATGLTFAYERDDACVLDGVGFVWEGGDPFVLEGPNGAGKSTVLRLLLALREPDAGTIRVGESDLRALDLRTLRRAATYLPQQPYLGPPHATVREAMRVVDPETSDEAILRALDRVALLPMLAARREAPLDVAVGELSAGQRQRLALARALSRDAPMVLLDEPDANVDAAGVALVARVIGELVASGKMVAVSAHTTELADASRLRLKLR